MEVVGGLLSYLVSEPELAPCLVAVFLAALASTITGCADSVCKLIGAPCRELRTKSRAYFRHASSKFFEWLAVAIFRLAAFLLLVLLVLMFGWLALIKTWVPAKPQPQAKQDYSAIPPVKWDDKWIVYPSMGTDAAGRVANFKFVVVSKDFAWATGSVSEVIANGRREALDQFLARSFVGSFSAELSSALDVIAVGVASQEGGMETEQYRAEQRAKTIADLLADYMKGSKQLWHLNLGQYKKICAECETSETSFQRPLLVVITTSKQEGVHVGQALASAMNANSLLPHTDNYSAYVMMPHTRRAN